MTEYVIGSGGSLQRGDTLTRTLTYTKSGTDFTDCSVSAYEYSRAVVGNMEFSILSAGDGSIQIYCELSSANTANLYVGKLDWFTLAITLSDGSVDVTPKIYLQVE